jgi:SAM-dependent methyltransferase
MTVPMHVNLCVIQPAGQVHALGLIDPALYVQHQFQRLGARVTLSKNRLMRDAVNLVFGAHLGFDPALKRDHTCLFVNLEQLGHGGAKLPLSYLELLRHSLVIDYHAANLAAYGADAEDVPLISFGHAPYLPKAPISAAAIAARPIDLLFFGSMNERRAKLIARIEACGRKVTTLNTPVYGPERDLIVAQARGVLNCHFYASARFEQVRAFQVLSLGTPLVAERTFGTDAGEAFDTCSIWFDDLQLERFFTEEYASPLYFEVAAQALDVFQQADPIEAYADCLAFACGVHKVELSRRGSEPRAVKRLHIGSGRDYRPGWLNIDIQDSNRPDAVLDLGRPQAWPLQIDSPLAGRLTLAEDSLDEIYASNVLEHVPDLAQMMSHCLALLKTGGIMTIEVPHERAPGAWQDPTHVRAMNDNSWRYYTDWFWYLGWFSHRFEKTAFHYLDHRLAPCEREAAWFMRVQLTKVETTLAERMVARTQRADFGPLYALGTGECADQHTDEVSGGDSGDNAQSPAHPRQPALAHTATP